MPSSSDTQNVMCRQAQQGYLLDESQEYERCWGKAAVLVPALPHVRILPSPQGKAYSTVYNRDTRGLSRMVGLLGYLLEFHLTRSNTLEAVSHEDAERADTVSKVLPDGKSARLKGTFAKNKEPDEETNRSHVRGSRQQIATAPAYASTLKA